MPKKPKPPVKQSPELRAYLEACAKSEAEHMKLNREMAQRFWKLVKKSRAPQPMTKVLMKLDDEGED